MATTRKTATKKAPAASKVIRHARIELPGEDYERLRQAATANGLPMAAYIRRAVLREIRRDETEEGVR